MRNLFLRAFWRQRLGTASACRVRCNTPGDRESVSSIYLDCMLPRHPLPGHMEIDATRASDFLVRDLRPFSMSDACTH
eukprot:1917432-Pleurochrysis_carterae.AAC.2